MDKIDQLVESKMSSFDEQKVRLNGFPRDFQEAAEKVAEWAVETFKNKGKRGIDKGSAPLVVKALVGLMIAIEGEPSVQDRVMFEVMDYVEDSPEDFGLSDGAEEREIGDVSSGIANSVVNLVDR